MFIPAPLQPNSLAKIKALPNPTVIFKLFFKQNLSRILESIKRFPKTSPTEPTLESETDADSGSAHAKPTGHGESPNLSMHVSCSAHEAQGGKRTTLCHGTVCKTKALGQTTF